MSDLTLDLSLGIHLCYITLTKKGFQMMNSRQRHLTLPVQYGLAAWQGPAKQEVWTWSTLP